MHAPKVSKDGHCSDRKRTSGEIEQTCRPEVPLVEHRYAISLNVSPLYIQRFGSFSKTRPSVKSCAKLLISTFKVS